MELDGTVGAIGGVKQKTYGVREAKADVFLVPVAGDNAAEAKHYAHGLRIIPVRSFPQALQALATLPLKR
jgi:Lon-like protease